MDCQLVGPRPQGPRMGAWGAHDLRQKLGNQGRVGEIDTGAKAQPLGGSDRGVGSEPAPSSCLTGDMRSRVGRWACTAQGLRSLRSLVCCNCRLVPSFALIPSNSRGSCELAVVACDNAEMRAGSACQVVAIVLSRKEHGQEIAVARKSRMGEGLQQRRSESLTSSPTDPIKVAVV